MDNVTGLNDMDSAISKLSDELKNELPNIVMKAAQIIASEVQARAPVGTGALKRSIDVVASGSGQSASATVQVEDSTQGGIEHYAIYTEYGTSREVARPFFRPGVQAASAQVENLITQRITQIIEQP